MMPLPSTRDLIQMVQSAGYQIVGTQQLRTNRWLFMLSDASGTTTLVLIQDRTLVNAADVQDLAELARLRQPARAILLAYSGTFSPAAQSTLAEMGDDRLRLCTTLPPAQADPDDLRNTTAALHPAR